MSVSRADIFSNTGIQFVQIKTLYQRLEMVRGHSLLLDIAEPRSTSG